MLIHCPEPCVTCQPPPVGAEGIGIFPNPNDPNNPFANLSAEAPDVPIFIGTNYDGGGPNNDGPSIGDPFTATGCVGVCISKISQEDADLCAAAQKAICDNHDDPTYPFCVLYPTDPQCLTPTVNPCVTNPSLPGCKPAPRPMFGNDATSCSNDCGDGSSSVVTVPAGTFVSPNKDTANLMAQTYACNTVRGVRLCLGNLSATIACLGDAFSASIVATYNPNVAPINITFEISFGLPNGLSFQQDSESSIVIFGIPTRGDTFTFTVTASSALGPIITKTYTIRVKGISTSSPLPDATSGTAYSKQLAIAGPFVGIPVWTLTGGSLPPGLVLSPDGEIFGVPTDTQSLTYGFTVKLSDDESSCSKSFSLTVMPAGCPDWTALAWDPPSLFTFGAGAAASAIGVADTFVSSTSVVDEETEVASVTDLAFLSYNGPGCNGMIHYETTISGANGGAGWGFQLTNNTDAIIIVNINSIVSEIVDVPFVIPGTGGATKQYAIQLSGGCGSFAGPPPTPSQADITLTISNVP